MNISILTDFMDLDTLIFVQFGVLLISFTALHLVNQISHDNPSALQFWRSGTAILAIGSLCLALFNQLPVMLSVIPGVTFHMFGYVLFWKGTKELFKQQADDTKLLLFCLISFFILVSLTTLIDSYVIGYGLRVILDSFVITLFCVLSLMTIYRSDHKVTLGSSFLFIGFLGIGFFAFLRLAITVFDLETKPKPIDLMTFFSHTIFIVVLVLGVVVYILQQLNEAREQAQQDLIAARNEAERANNAKSDFLSNMSHELRTPLNAILGFSQLMEDSTDEESRQNSKEIYKAGEHLLHLINETLDIAKIEAGKIDLHIESVEFDSVLTESISLIRPGASKRNIHIDRSSCDMADCQINVDRSRFKQILLNLLSNAVKYNNDAGHIVIDCEQDHQKAMFKVSITDTGHGLSAEQQEKIFMPFERVGAQHTGAEGTGLGLVISKELIELMGGQIGVESQLSKGSTFWLEVPLS